MDQECFGCLKEGHFLIRTEYKYSNIYFFDICFFIKGDIDTNNLIKTLNIQRKEGIIYFKIDNGGSTFVFKDLLLIFEVAS